MPLADSWPFLYYDAYTCTVAWQDVAGVGLMTLACGAYLGTKWRDWRAWMRSR